MLAPPKKRRFSLSCFEDWVNSLLFRLSILEWFSISSDNCVEQRWESRGILEINSLFDILDFISNIKFITGVKSFKASSKIFNNLSSGNSIPHPSTIVIPSFEPLINISINRWRKKKLVIQIVPKYLKHVILVCFFLLAYFFYYIHTIFTIYKKSKKIIKFKALAMNSWIKNDWQTAFLARKLQINVFIQQ